MALEPVAKKDGKTDYRDLLQKIVARTGSNREHLIPVLLALQDILSYLPMDLLEMIPSYMACSHAEVMGTATFYALFRFRPAGQHHIKVCVGTACHIKGADRIYSAFREHLALPEGEDTDRNREYTLSRVGCLGCCMLAPTVQIDRIIFGPVSPDEVDQLLAVFKEKTAASEERIEEASTVPPPAGHPVLKVCLCSSCRAAGSDRIYGTLAGELARRGLSALLKETGCSGASFLAPMLEVEYPDGRVEIHFHLSVERTRRLTEDLFPYRRLGERVHLKVRRWLDVLLREDSNGTDPAAEEGFTGDSRSFLNGQVRLAAGFRGRLTPLDAEEYRRNGGFKVLEDLVRMGDREAVMRRLDESGLRGRGGAGFPAFRKWSILAECGDAEKYLVCNGDEGDPGAFMDRMIMESFPFQVIEGVLIAAWTLRVSAVFIYIRAEYPLAFDRISTAVSLGRDNLDPGSGKFPASREEELLGIPVRVVKGAGAFVCGEETALIRAIEGGRGIPRQKPPYPAQSGLWGRPTLVNNVETLALLPSIFQDNGSAGIGTVFSSHGTTGNSGSKTFALAGKIKRGGLIEVPLGISLRRIVEDIGGGVPEPGRFKAVQIGGPAGGFLPDDELDSPLTFDSLQSRGALMGSGGLVVLDNRDCMVEKSRYFLEFCLDESCGKCTYCRVGLQRILDELTRLCSGESGKVDLEELEKLACEVRKLSLCGLGRGATNPLLSALRYFRAEFEAHTAGKCPAGECPDLFQYMISDSCLGCGICSRSCPNEAIPFTPYEKHIIDQEKCVKCGTCYRLCPGDAVDVC